MTGTWLGIGYGKKGTIVNKEGRSLLRASFVLIQSSAFTTGRVLVVNMPARSSVLRHPATKTSYRMKATATGRAFLVTSKRVI